MNDAVTEIDANLPAKYLLNVVEALRTQVLPELHNSAKDRLGECMTIIARAVTDLQTGTPETGSLQGNDRRGLAMADGAALDHKEATFEALQHALEILPPGASSRVFSGEKLLAYLASHERGGPDTRLTKVRVLAGGRSKQTVLIEQEGAIDLPRDLVVRQDWSSAVTGTSVVTEFALVNRVAEAGIKAPRAYILEHRPECLGAPFMIMQRMPGQPRGDIFFPPKSAALARDLAGQLALLHSLPTAQLSAQGIATEAFSTAQLREGLAKFRATQSNVGIRTPTIDLALDWLETAIPHVTGNVSVVHNDLGCHNFLIEGESLSAILDWELAQLGNPAADLGYIRYFVEKMTDWDDFMANYYAAGGPQVTAETLDFYGIWCAVRLYCLLMQARAGIAMGMVRDTEITYACAHFIPQQMRVLSWHLRRVLGR